MHNIYVWKMLQCLAVITPTNLRQTNICMYTDLYLYTYDLIYIHLLLQCLAVFTPTVLDDILQKRPIRRYSAKETYNSYISCSSALLCLLQRFSGDELYISETLSLSTTCTTDSLLTLRICVDIQICVDILYINTYFRYGVATISRLLEIIVSFAEYCLFYRALL